MTEKDAADIKIANMLKPKTSAGSQNKGNPADDGFCTAAGAYSPKPSETLKTGRLRDMLNKADRA